MAALRPHVGRAAALPLLASLALSALVGLRIALPSSVAADDPTPPPAEPARTTCADRFPAEGPAGVDLRLGCIVGELVGLYTASSDAEPAPISTYAIVLAGGIAAAALVAWLLLRALARRAGRRLAPVMPGTWWICDRCRSVNAADARRCYACGAPTSGGPPLPTSDRPETPQSFGDGRKRG